MVFYGLLFIGGILLSNIEHEMTSKGGCRVTLRHSDPIETREIALRGILMTL